MRKIPRATEKRTKFPGAAKAPEKQREILRPPIGKIGRSAADGGLR
jgi:hypothetical protein